MKLLNAFLDKISLQSLKNTLLRFPLPFTIALAFTIIVQYIIGLILMHKVGGLALSNILDKCLVWLLLLFHIYFLAFLLSIISEALLLTKFKKLLLFAAGIIYSFFYYKYFLNVRVDSGYFSDFLFYIASTLVFALGVVVVFKIKNSDKNLWEITAKGVDSLVNAFLYSGVITIGIALLFFSIELLFGSFEVAQSELRHNIMVRLIASFWTLLFPTLFLSFFPKELDKVWDKESFKSPVFDTITIKVFGIINILYLSLIYYYIFVSIFFKTEKVSETVVYLILFLFCFIFINWLSTYTRIDEPGNKTLKFLIKNTFSLSIIPIVFLMGSYITRVLDFGFTINRYILIAALLYLAIISTVNIVKRKQDLGFVLTTLFWFVFIATWTPLGFKTVPEVSQISEINKIILNLNAYKDDGTIDQETLNLNRAEAIRIKNIIHYLYTSHGFKRLCKEFNIKDNSACGSDNNTKGDENLILAYFLGESYKGRTFTTLYNNEGAFEENSHINQRLSNKVTNYETDNFNYVYMSNYIYDSYYESGKRKIINSDCKSEPVSLTFGEMKTCFQDNRGSLKLSFESKNDRAEINIEQVYKTYVTNGYDDNSVDNVLVIYSANKTFKVIIKYYYFSFYGSENNPEREIKIVEIEGLILHN